MNIQIEMTSDSLPQFTANVMRVTIINGLVMDMPLL